MGKRLQESYLVNIWVTFRISQHVKSCVQIIEHPHDLHRAFVVVVPGAVVGKTNNAAKEKGYGIVATSWDRALMTELGGDAYWQD